MKYIFKKPFYIFAAFLIDALGTVIFFPRKIFKNRAPQDPESILVVRLDHIGDFVCTTPLIKNLKNRFPDAKITVLVNAASKDLAYRDPGVDKVITYSPFYLSRGERSSASKGFMRVIKDVRNIGFDLGLDPRGDLLSILIMWLGGAKYRIGYGITGGSFLLNKEVRYDDNIHVVDRNLALLKDMDIPIQDRLPSVYFNEKDMEVVDRTLREIKVGAKKIVLHSFAGAQARGWTRDNFQQIINRLKDSGVSTFLIGTNSDSGGYEDVVDMRGKFNLPQLAYFIKSIGYFIGLNSGPANIATAFGVPSVIISSGSNIVEHWMPVSKNTRFIYKDIECRPCERKICPKNNYECMDNISVDEVMKAVRELGV